MARTRTCSYVVAVERAMSDDELREMAAYLSEIRVAGCDVAILDGTAAEQFSLHATFFRWVGRHLPVTPEQRTGSGRIDRIRAASDAAICEKMIVAEEDVRWSPEAIREAAGLLERCEVIEPHEYLDPLPWWSAIDAGRALLLRGVERGASHASTIAIRRRTARVLRLLAPVETDAGLPESLSAAADVFVPAGLFVRRVPRGLREWVRRRPGSAMAEFAMPVRSGFFLSLLPMLLFFLIAGGVGFGSMLGGFVAAGAVMLALRGRAGAARFFPLRACFLAPLALLERSVSCYWALARKLCGADASPSQAESGEAGRRAANG